MTPALTYTIPQQEKKCDIFVESGLLDNLSAMIDLIRPLGTSYAIVTVDKLLKIYGEPLKKRLESSGIFPLLITFEDGEQHKTSKTKAQIEDTLFKAGFGRDTCLIALGGGVVTDITGYVAATYCRGIPFVSIPTTLLAMVDASLGGKTGINTPYGKNLLGAIHHPKFIFTDPSTLKTLPKSELQNGFAEMIKHGLIADKAHFEFLENYSNKLLTLDFELLKKAILDSCRIKTTIVTQDERDTGIRHLLNYGHTVGHALETLSNYDLPHGQAVAIGIVVESRIAFDEGLLQECDYLRIIKILEDYGLPHAIPRGYTPEAIFKAMKMDKKAKIKKPHAMLLQEIGVAHSQNGIYTFEIDEKVFAKNTKKLQGQKEQTR